MVSVNNITTILFLSLVIVAHAQASEPTVITLSCDGTVKTSVGNIEGPRKAINKLDAVVDLADQTSRSLALSHRSKTSTALLSSSGAV
jgi:hypothetical protein